jgi:hypothetical protein
LKFGKIFPKGKKTLVVSLASIAKRDLAQNDDRFSAHNLSKMAKKKQVYKACCQTKNQSLNVTKKIQNIFFLKFANSFHKKKVNNIFVIESFFLILTFHILVKFHTRSFKEIF